MFTYNLQDVYRPIVLKKNGSYIFYNLKKRIIKIAFCFIPAMIKEFHIMDIYMYFNRQNNILFFYLVLKNKLQKIKYLQGCVVLSPING